MPKPFLYAIDVAVGMAIGLAAIVFIETVFAWVDHSRAVPTKQAEQYWVRLFSGGEVVAYWIVDERPQVTDSSVRMGNKTVIGGTVVIEQYVPSKPH